MRVFWKKKGFISGVTVLLVFLNVVLSGCLLPYIFEDFNDGIANDWDDDGGKWSVKMVTTTDGKYVWYPQGQWPNVDQTMSIYKGHPGNQFVNFSVNLDGKYYFHANELNQTIGIVYRYTDPGHYGLFYLDFFFTQSWYVYRVNTDLSPSYKKVASGYGSFIDIHENNLHVSVNEHEVAGTNLIFYINDKQVHSYWEKDIPKAGSLGIFSEGYTGDEVFVDNVRISWDGVLPTSKKYGNEKELPSLNLPKLRYIFRERFPNIFPILKQLLEK